MAFRDSHGRFFAQSLTERREMILQGNTFKVLLLLSLPTLLMGFVSALIPLTDGLFLNNSSGYVVAGAVGYSQPVINMLNAMAQGLATATMAIVGQLYGLGDFYKVRKASTQIIVFAFFIGLAMIPLLLITSAVISSSLEPELGKLVRLYLNLYSLNMPFFFLATIYNAIRNATGQPEATFYRMIFLLIFKLIFNTIFLVVFRLGVAGAALASLASYLIISLFMYYDMFVREGELSLSLRGFVFDKLELRRVLKIGIPTMLSSFMISFGFFLINQEIVSSGKVVLNAQTIASNLNAISFTLPASIGTTITTIISMKVAAGQVKKAKRTFVDGCILSLIISALIIVIFIPSAELLVQNFLNHPGMAPELRQEIMAIAVYALRIYTWAIIGFGIFMVAQGAFIALAKTKIPLIGGILRIWFFRYLFILAFRSTMGYTAVFWGNLLSNYLAAVILVVILFKSDWEKDLVFKAELKGK